MVCGSLSHGKCNTLNRLSFKKRHDNFHTIKMLDKKLAKMLIYRRFQ